MGDGTEGCVGDVELGRDLAVNAGGRRTTSRGQHNPPLDDVQLAFKMRRDPPLVPPAIILEIISRNTLDTHQIHHRINPTLFVGIFEIWWTWLHHRTYRIENVGF